MWQVTTFMPLHHVMSMCNESDSRPSLSIRFELAQFKSQSTMYFGLLFYKAWPNMWPKIKVYTNALTCNLSYFKILLGP